MMNLCLNGFVGGALHGLTGPDHLAVLLPFSIGKSWSAWKTGFIWGLGHGLGLMLFGFISYFIKSFLPFDVLALAHWLDIIIGLSIMSIGIMGVYEVFAERKKFRGDKKDDISLQEFEKKRKETHKMDSPKSVIMTGIIQGFSGSGHFLGVIPAIAIPEFLGASLYLLMFCLGTVLVMSLFTGLVGKATDYLIPTGDLKSSADQLALFVSGFAIVVGFCYVLYSLI